MILITAVHRLCPLLTLTMSENKIVSILIALMLYITIAHFHYLLIVLQVLPLPDLNMWDIFW